MCAVCRHQTNDIATGNWGTVLFVYAQFAFSFHDSSTTESKNGLLFYGSLQHQYAFIKVLIATVAQNNIQTNQHTIEWKRSHFHLAIEADSVIRSISNAPEWRVRKIAEQKNIPFPLWPSIHYHTWNSRRYIYSYKTHGKWSSNLA